MSHILKITCEYDDCTTIVSGATAVRCIWLWNMWYRLSKWSTLFKLEKS